MRRTLLASTAMFIAASALLSACGGDGDGGTSTPASTATQVAATATRTAAATIPASATTTATAPATPTATAPPAATATTGSSASVAGLVVLRDDFRANASDALDAPPAAWMNKPGADGFDRALSHAEWKIVGQVERQGETSADGSFAIEGLPPGPYLLEISKTLNGDLLGVTVPFEVGDGGRAQVIVEIAQGLVRWSNAFERDGSDVLVLNAPNGSRVVTRDGKITELSAPGQTYLDADGDGSFDPSECHPATSLWLCGENRDCGADRVCGCAGSCPLCEDCPFSVCAPPSARPYTCSEQNPCKGEGEKCVCVSSCPECDDCATSVCVSSCDPARITGIRVSGPSRLFLGQSSAMYAVAELSDGWVIDVTQLVDWHSSDATVVSVDSWGTLTPLAVGAADIDASLAGSTSPAWKIEVDARPQLQAIYLQNVSCSYPPDQRPDVGPGGASPPSLPSDALPPPNCRQVVRLGGSLQFFALGQYEGGYYEDVTALVDWDLTSPATGTVSKGLFTAAEVGSTQLRARLGAVSSNPTEIQVVDHATVIALQIYPLVAVPRPGPQPVESPADAAIPCYDCGYAVTILKGDELPFQATAAYDTGEWEDVTARVTWSSSNPSVASIGATGVVGASSAGETTIGARLDLFDSNPVTVRVVESASLLSLSIYQEGLDLVVAKGDRAFFHAFGFYDVGFERDATASAAWKSSDETIGGFDGAGSFVGRSAGNVQVWAELDGVQSNRLPLEVFQTSTLGYCDDNNINRAEWSDAFNRVVLESDCGLYTHPDVATLRFTVTERERPHGIFDPCLDLYVQQGTHLVRTIREEGCGQPFLAPGAPEFDDAKLRYQSLAFWDLKDDRGSPVPPGAYTIRGRFYLYFDPIIELQVVVSAPDGRIPCEVESCGNGCGYVHACGDGGLPPGTACPTVCTTICSCPAGWGITPQGDCEPCVDECCPQGAACAPGALTCEPPPVCCPEGQACIPELPPCDARCCPFGALCGPLDLKPCECCPAGAECDASNLPRCEPPPPCCAPGDQCADGSAPCEQPG